MGEHAGPKAVVDAHHRRAGGAGIEHGEKRRHAPEARSVADARGNGDQRFGREPPHHAGEDAIHSRHHDEDPGRVELGPFVENPVQSRNPDIILFFDPAS